MTKIRVNVNSIDFKIAEMYCDTKSGLWRIFFGWYKTSGEWAYYRISKKAWNKIYDTSREIELDYDK